MPFFNNLSTLFGTKNAQEGAQRAQSHKKYPKKTAGKQTQPTNGQKQAKQQKPHQTPGKAQHSQSAPSARNQAQQPAPIVQPQHAPLRIEADRKEAQAIISEANSKARDILVDAKAEALSIRARAEQQEREVIKKLEEQQRDLTSKLDRIDDRLSQIDTKESRLEEERARVARELEKVEEQKQSVAKRLEDVSGMTREEAKTALFETLEKRLSRQLAQFIKQKEEEAKEVADEKVQEILTDAMKHGATDYVAEYTISTVAIPNEETKGKIIGKNGRNIHTFEKYTGVDLDLDTSPTEVRLSCFDPVRREVARIALERLIKDGRIQPTRIEEVVNKVRTEIDKITFEAGKQLCHDVGVYNLPADLMRMLGKFKYRFSYGQNLIAHTLEETRIGIKIAHELKADVNVVKLGCLLHDIGKVSEDEDGSHVELGVRIAKKFGLPQPVIDCIAQHHEDEPFSGVEQMIVYIADAISGARPGARYENYDEYVKRLRSLEDIAMQYPGIRQAYAIQAGREIRVVLDPEATKDNDVMVLATKIRDEIKEKLTYPGTVTVNVSREVIDQKVAT